MSFQATILADSLGKNNGVRLTTMEVTFPRFILAEVNTHRVFSRNSASSRAIPTRKILTEIRDNPFIPEVFGSYQPGMVSGQALNDAAQLRAHNEWIAASHDAIAHALHMVYGDSVNVHDFLAGGELPAADENSVHKEIVNRIVEPYMWHTAIISATEWENFFHLRLASDAQPQIRTLALTMKEAMNSSQPELLSAGQWHLPLVSDEEKGHYPYSQLLALSAGRCARVSYLTHDKRRDVSQDMKLAQRLLESGHMSPFEHQAQPKMSHTLGNFTQWRQFRHDAEELQGQGKSLL